MYRSLFAWTVLVNWVQRHPIGFPIWMAATGSAMTGAAYLLSSTPGADRPWISAGAILAAPLATLVIRFIAAFFAAPRRYLEIELGEERKANYQLRAIARSVLAIPAPQ
jgi:hypothetical protein